jgi:hypothetical protein
VAFEDGLLMNNELINKWEALLSTLTIIRQSNLICSEAEIGRECGCSPGSFGISSGEEI